MNKASIVAKANKEAAKAGVDMQVVSQRWGRQVLVPLPEEVKAQGGDAAVLLSRKNNYLVSYVAIAALQPEG